MNLSDLVGFRRDLLFQGAVQVGWFETDDERSRKAAEHFVFHGPDYHGVREQDFGPDSAYRLKDTATFTRDIIEHLIAGVLKDNPFALAVAGYGTGKSHLALTLAALLSDPKGQTAQKVFSNLQKADKRIGEHVQNLLAIIDSPFLVVALNGMEDFDLVGEITQKILHILGKKGISTAPLDDLRPRFKIAQNFTDSYFSSTKDDFLDRFGSDYSKEQILELLGHHDETAFKIVSDIFEAKMGTPLRAVGQESLQDFLSVVRQKYCGPGKPFKGLIIIFDEFGRYLEFAVQKPHVAGTGGLQQLFEAIQENSDTAFLLGFIQNELRAYASRVAPELRDSLERYISRYDLATKLRLSTNLETIIANLLEKREPDKLENFIRQGADHADHKRLMGKLRDWFPDMQNHSLWNDSDLFPQVIVEGCWPLHPSSSWLLYHLSSAGKSLQQRSAISFLEDVYDRYKDKEIGKDFWSIPPVDLCNDDMITEFLKSEQFGHQGAIAHAYESALQRLEHELTPADKAQLKSVLIAAKIGIRLASENEGAEALAMLTGLSARATNLALNRLKADYGLLEWNEVTNQFDIVGDAVPRRAFIAFLGEQVQQVSSEKRARLFASNMQRWCEIERHETDFGSTNGISTTEWNYFVKFSNVFDIEASIKFALREWKDALAVDTSRGQAIYCYIGPESNVQKVREDIQHVLTKEMQDIGISLESGVPVVVILLSDEDGLLGEMLAENWVLTEQAVGQGFEKFSIFVTDRKILAKDELQNRFKKLQKDKDLIIACKKEIPGQRFQAILSNLFEAVYPDRIPFPFDGFHTARGNAATDCRQFTLGLFTSSLDQTSIAALPPRQKNRAVTVLHESWKILANDGSITTKPQNPRVAAIIESMNSLLEKGRPLNLGKAVRQMCSPPIGCNIASAGLLLGVFLSPRKNQFTIIRNHSQISVENWISDAFKGNYLDISVLDETDILFISKGESDKWQSLLDEWEIEKTYEGQIEYLKKSLILIQRVNIPPIFHYRLELLQGRAKVAREKIKHYDTTLERQAEFILRANERGHAGNLARCGAELAKLIQSMRETPNAWTKEQYKVATIELQKATQATIQYFSNWLDREIVTNPLQFENFKHRMKLTADNLNTLGLENEASKVNEHITKVSSDVERLVRINTIIEEVRFFIASTRVTSATRVNEISNYLDRIRQMETTFQEAAQGGFTVPQLENAFKNLMELKEKCQNQLNIHKERAGEVWNKEIQLLQDIVDTAQEVRALMTIYDGREDDLQDFRLMIKVLAKFEEHYHLMDSLTITNSELKDRFQNALEEVNNILTEDDEIPWDIETTYSFFLKEIEYKRSDAATKWMAQNVPTGKEIKSMDAMKANRILVILSSPPSVLTTNQEQDVKAAREACSKRLDNLKVDGLLARFKDLSRDAQIMFFQQIQQMISGN